MVRTDCHTFDPLFSPLTSAEKPCFCQKFPKSFFFFHTVQNFANYSLKDPKSVGIWEKGTQMPLIFMAFVTERPLIFYLACTCLRGILLPQTRSAEAGKFCILETESCNLMNTFRCKLNQGDENKISVQAQPTQLYIMDELHWRAGLIHRPSSLWSNTEGDISYNHPLYDCAQLGSLNKCQLFLRLCKWRHFKGAHH